MQISYEEFEKCFIQYETHNLCDIVEYISDFGKRLVQLIPYITASELLELFNRVIELDAELEWSNNTFAVEINIAFLYKLLSDEHYISTKYIRSDELYMRCKECGYSA